MLHFKTLSLWASKNQRPKLDLGCPICHEVPSACCASPAFRCEAAAKSSWEAPQGGNIVVLHYIGPYEAIQSNYQNIYLLRDNPWFELIWFDMIMMMMMDDGWCMMDDGWWMMDDDDDDDDGWWMTMMMMIMTWEGGDER